MPLLNEGVDVWRPVAGKPTGVGYRIHGPMPSDEEWTFKPGAVVRCEEKRLASGARGLVAVRAFWDAQSVNYWDDGHPYRWRCWIRSYLPWWMIDLGLAAKAADCEREGGWHRWYAVSDEIDGCFHCEEERRVNSN